MPHFLRALFVFSACSGVLQAQVGGSLSGSAVDATGAAVPGATVNLYLAGSDQPILTTRTNDAGLFTFVAIGAVTYDLAIEVSGFARFVTRAVKVDPIQQTNLGALQLEVAGVQQMVEVTAEVQRVQTGGSELSTTITRNQIQNLPVLARQVSNLFQTQAGVSTGRGPTVINGLRTSAANVTLDGINIQDNFIRTNSLNFMPFRTTIEQIADMTVSVGNSGSTVGGGAAQVALSTRSGGNETHGAAYWYNRNNKLSANDWFNNRAGVERPFLNLNQIGGYLGGRIIKDKLFFFGNYEAYRERQQASTLRTVLTAEARSGLFRYRTTASALNQVNVLTTRQVRLDPTVAGFLDQLPQPNTTDAGDGLNTSGYRFNARDNSRRDQMVTRGDYYVNSSHILTGTFNFTRERNDRPTLGDFYTTIPPVYDNGRNYLASLAWRWTLSPTFTNEARGGFNLGPSTFDVDGDYPQFIVDGLNFSTPQNRFFREGRETNTYSVQDNATWLRGRHEIAFGFQTQLVRSSPFFDDGIVPAYTVGISPENRTGFTAAELPGIRAQDIGIANGLYSSLAGIISGATRDFNVTDRNSGFVAGAPNRRNFSYDTYAGYVQDKWKVNRGLTLTLGLRYEYWTRLDERDGLFLMPRIVNNNHIQTLLSNATLDFAGRAVGRPFYNADRNNIAPSFGFAWDPWGSGRTVIRGAYSLSYFNDDSITAIRNNLATNDGLLATSELVNLAGTLAARPSVPTPAFKVPRTQEDNFDLSPSAGMGLPDPNLRTPYVQQFSFGIQHEVKGGIVEARYVGNHGTKLLRAFDYNQVVIRENGFLEDFNRARSNGLLSLAATGRFNPDFNGNLPGSQPLTLFPLLFQGGLLANATVQTLIRQGEVGSLAQIYQTNGLNGSVDFFRNPFALGTNTITNGGDSTYHALQLDWRRRSRQGLELQANYTFSKVLSNTIGDNQVRFEPFLDLDSPSIERARAPFDLTHAIKANAAYELPLGKGKRWALSGAADRILGGWSLSGIMTYNSGTPFSIFSDRGTLNRGARSTGRNTATSLSTKPELDQKVGRLVMTGDGPFFVDPSAISNRRGTSSDGDPAFPGQLFYNPGPGQLGTLQRRMFSGPWNFDMDFSLLKRVQTGERQQLEFRADAFSAFNNQSFWVGDESLGTARFNINNTNFGRVNGTFTGRRVIQIGLYYRF
ncbi:MAG: TonB-dependent receptor [Bryobacteraceae bacterium]|nr:TonB-dependent receptor [Bryobacteraceae bacterium]